MARRKRWTLVFSAATLLMTQALAAQAGAPTGQPAEESAAAPMLRVTARVVAISAVVKGRDGALTTGLSKADFELKQDGKPEPIRYVSAGADLPLTLALLVDTSGSQRTFLGDETLASEVFLETMLGRPQDRALVVEVGSRVRALGALTDSVSRLKLELTALGTDRSAMGGTLLNDAVAGVAQKVLAPAAGRKAMILLTDGEDNGSRLKLEQAIEQAQLADLQVYSILYSVRHGIEAGDGPRGAMPATDPGLDALLKLSESTGGQVFAVSPRQTLRQIYAEIAQDLRLQYQVSYTPPPDLKPGSYHRLELRARDHRLAVEARKGFFAKP